MNRIKQFDKIEKKMSKIIYEYQFKQDKPFPWSDIHKEVVKLGITIDREKRNV